MGNRRPRQLVLCLDLRQRLLLIMVDRSEEDLSPITFHEDTFRFSSSKLPSIGCHGISADDQEAYPCRAPSALCCGHVRADEHNKTCYHVVTPLLMPEVPRVIELRQHGPSSQTLELGYSTTWR